jgi:predicted ATP-dependent serine protease
MHAQLPDDIIILVFEFLNFNKELLFAIEQVSHQFYNIVSQDAYWKPIFTAKYKNCDSKITKNYRRAYTQLSGFVKKFGKIIVTGNILNVGVIGESGVGKTTIVLHYMRGEFIDDYDPTM